MSQRMQHSRNASSLLEFKDIRIIVMDNRSQLRSIVRHLCIKKVYIFIMDGALGTMPGLSLTSVTKDSMSFLVRGGNHLDHTTQD